MLQKAYSWALHLPRRLLCEQDAGAQSQADAPRAQRHCLHSARFTIQQCTRGSDAWRVVLEHAHAALFGDRTCAEGNVEDSCFGAEWCDRSAGVSASAFDTKPSFAKDLMRRNTCYAAVKVASGGANADRFLGLVAISPQQVLHTFCVAHAARGEGVGRALMDHVLERHSDALELTVAAPLNASGSSPASKKLEKRSAKLLSFYQGYGFACVDAECNSGYDGYIHMVRPLTTTR